MATCHELAFSLISCTSSDPVEEAPVAEEKAPVEEKPAEEEKPAPVEEKKEAPKKRGGFFSWFRRK